MEDYFKSWIAEGSKMTQARYKLCQKFFNIFNTGHQALVNNFSWKKHKEHLKRVVLSPRAVTAIIKLLEKLSPTLSKVQTTTDVSLTNAETLKAEIKSQKLLLKQNTKWIRQYIFKDVLW